MAAVALAVTPAAAAAAAPPSIAIVATATLLDPKVAAAARPLLHAGRPHQPHLAVGGQRAGRDSLLQHAGRHATRSGGAVPVRAALHDRPWLRRVCTHACWYRAVVLCEQQWQMQDLAHTSLLLKPASSVATAHLAAAATIAAAAATAASTCTIAATLATVRAAALSTAPRAAALAAPWPP